MSDQIKSMQLYPRADRIYAELEALGYGPGAQVTVDVLNQFDQLHYHGTDALDAAISACGMGADHAVLEVGSGWGGCARYLAQTSGAALTAIELQEDYHTVARDLTDRAGMSARISHVNADFLEWDAPREGFDHAVSWLALFHIPDRPRYQSKIHGALKPGGAFFAEDLYAMAPPEDEDDFARHLFPNSLVSLDGYRRSLSDAGFVDVDLREMTDDWSACTADGVDACRENRDAYEAKHGADGYDSIHVCYEKMAGYFADGVVGGLQISVRRPA